MSATVRRARAADAETLSALALRAKAVWGYDADFLERCRAELTLTPADCAADGVFVAEDAAGGETEAAGRAVPVLGFARVTGAGPVGELDALFVEPAAMRRGVGRLLLAHAAVYGHALGWTGLALDADPGARPFYERMGARVMGSSPSGSIPGRELPRMLLPVSALRD